MWVEYILGVHAVQGVHEQIQLSIEIPALAHNVKESWKSLLNKNTWTLEHFYNNVVSSYVFAVHKLFMVCCFTWTLEHSKVQTSL